MRVLMTFLCLLVPSFALAIGSDSVCGGLSPERDGIGCKVVYIDGMGDVLMVVNHTRKSDDPARIAAAKAYTRRVFDTFMGQGGTFMRMRTTRPDGVQVERACSRIKHRMTEHCDSWVPVKG